MKDAGKVFMGVMISVFIGMGWSVPVSAGTAMAAECSHEAGSILLNHQEEEKLICREEDERIVNAGETKGDRQGRMADQNLEKSTPVVILPHSCRDQKIYFGKSDQTLKRSIYK